MTVAADRYPTKAEITRVVNTARDLNIVVGGLEVGRDGTIRVLPPLPAVSADSGFDRWKAGRQKG